MCTLTDYIKLCSVNIIYKEKGQTKLPLIFELKQRQLIRDLKNLWLKCVLLMLKNCYFDRHTKDSTFRQLIFKIACFYPLVICYGYTLEATWLNNRILSKQLPKFTHNSWRYSWIRKNKNFLDLFEYPYCLKIWQKCSVVGLLASLISLFWSVYGLWFGLSQKKMKVSMHCIVKIVYDDFLCIVMHLLLPKPV